MSTASRSAGPSEWVNELRRQLENVEISSVSTIERSEIISIINVLVDQVVGVKLDNGDDTYPIGDEVQTVERWTPPGSFEGFSTADLNKALDRLRGGMDDGRLYSIAPSAKARAAWRVLREICPAQSEERCRKVIATWVKNGVFSIGTYYDEKERKENEGITGAKRIGEC
jgi:hypothetical protein